MTTRFDVRDLYYDGLRWATDLMQAVPTHRLGHTTPCPDFTVRSLMGHLIGTAERALATAQHRPTVSIPHVITDIPDEALASTYGALAARLRTAWSAVELTDAVHAPWGPTTGAAAVWGFATETVVHGWDLAIATDQPSEARSDLVQPLLARANTTVPARRRSASYASVVISVSDAGPTERLANWLGHRR